MNERQQERDNKIFSDLVERGVSRGFTLQDSLLGGERLTTRPLLLPLLLTQPGLQFLHLPLVMLVLLLQELHLCMPDDRASTRRQLSL